MAKRDKGLTAVQIRAIGLAREHGHVVIGRGFGCDDAPHAIASGTYVKLVMLGLLTPHLTGDPFEAPALGVYVGKHGYLTKAGIDYRKPCCWRTA